jgi:hypothetical protein
MDEVFNLSINFAEERKRYIFGSIVASEANLRFP